MFVYLAHPIDQNPPSGDSPLKVLLRNVKQAFNYQGISAFVPGQAYSLAFLYAREGDGVVARTQPEHMVKIDQMNRAAIWEADAVVAVLPPGMATLGVPAEIEHALMLNRPVLIVTTSALAATSVQIQAWLNRGCKLALVGSNFGFVEAYDIKAMLAALPDPTKLAVESENDGPPPLLVSGETGSLTKGKYEGDAGLDLAIMHDWLIENGEYIMMATGVHVAIPQGYFGLITGRSSTWAKHRCRVIQAVIDSGYRGELMIGVVNEGATVKFAAGTRLAQLILLPTFTGGLSAVDELPPSTRGLAGYGSSGA